MAKRDPKKAARNKLAKQLSDQINNLLPAVLKETGIETQSSLHGKYGGKFADYIDIKNAVIASPDHFISLYLEGFRREVIASKPDSANRRNYELLRRSKTLKEYLRLFLRRTYFRYYDALSKKRPKVEEATIWIGQQNASWGLLVTPRFNKVT
ncbi:MAG: topoisomerase, partial [Planctomycetes bacterium]|nr:topoisomerase [Planctomycetota bacterium]